MLYFSRDPAGPKTLSPARGIAMDALLDQVKDLTPLYSCTPPDSETCPTLVHGGTRTHVVIKVEGNEVNQLFPIAGYYLFPNVLAAKCLQLFKCAGQIAL